MMIGANWLRVSPHRFGLVLPIDPANGSVSVVRRHRNRSLTGPSSFSNTKVCENPGEMVTGTREIHTFSCWKTILDCSPMRTSFEKSRTVNLSERVDFIGPA